MSHTGTPQNKPGLWQIISSVLAAGFGVQSQANRERDFTSGSASHYVIVGILATILFIATLLFIVNLIV